MEGNSVRLTPTFSRPAALPTVNPPVNPEASAAAPAAPVRPKKPDLEVPLEQQPLFEIDQRQRELGASSTYQ